MRVKVCVCMCVWAYVHMCVFVCVYVCVRLCVGGTDVGLYNLHPHSNFVLRHILACSHRLTFTVGRSQPIVDTRSSLESVSPLC